MDLKYISTAGLLAVGLYFSVNVVMDVDRKSKEPVSAPIVEQKQPMPVIKEKPVKQPATSDKIPLSPELQTFARIQSELNGVPYVLVLAVMEQESRFDLEADGGDSFGLMQINECHGAREIIIEPHENIKIGTWLLGYLYREYRDWNKVLVAYNCGQQGAYEYYFRHGSISSPYSREVMLRSERFSKMLGEPSVLRPRR